MRLSDISVQRPVLATVLAALIVAFGLLALDRLPLQEYPSIDPPIVSIDTNYPGASADVVETRITQVLEDRISGVSGIEVISSSSSDGRSSIRVEFGLDKDIDAAANDIRDRIAGARDNLPDAADATEVRKEDSGSDVVIWLSLSGSDYDIGKLTDYAERYLTDRFSVLEGASQVIVGGGEEYAMRVWLDANALAARGLTVGDIEDSLREENVELPGGSVESRDRQFMVRLPRNFATPDDFRNLALSRDDNGYLVRLGDVARVEVGAVEDRSLFRGNGVPMVGLGIRKQSTSNVLALSDAVKEELARVAPTLPDGMELKLHHDASTFVSHAISEVVQTLFIAMGLVVVAIFIFLGNLRTTLVPAVTVPIALIGTFAALAAMGFTINLLTCLPGAGHWPDRRRRHRGAGEHPPPHAGTWRDSTGRGLPGESTDRLRGDRHHPGADRGVRAIELSARRHRPVVLGIRPDAGRRRLHLHAAGADPDADDGVQDPQARHARRAHCPWRASRPGCQPCRLSPNARARTALALGRHGAVSRRDRRHGLAQRPTAPGIHTPGGSRHLLRADQRTSRCHLRLHARLHGRNRGAATASARTWRGRTHPGACAARLGRHRELQQRLRDRQPQRLGQPALGLADHERDPLTPGRPARCSGLPGDAPGFGGGSMDQSMQFVLGGGTYEQLAEWRDTLIEHVRQDNPNLLNLDSDYEENQPQLRVDIDYDRAADLGVTISEIGSTLETLLGGRTVTRYVDDGQEYDVILEAERGSRPSPRSLDSLMVRSSRSGELVPLSSMVTLTDFAGPSTLNRYNRLRSITIQANLADGYSMGEALDYLETTADELLPPEVQTDVKGDARDYQEASSATTFLLALGVLVVFLVLAGQFESFIHPLVIMCTVPLAMIGALLGLGLTGQSLNTYSQVGLVMLVGLAAKNGILIVEFANQLRDAGHAFHDAWSRPR